MAAQLSKSASEAEYKMQAMILAAGMGRRLKRFTQDNTKCMVEVNGKRIIDYLLESIAHVNDRRTAVTRIVLVVGYEREKLMDYVGTQYDGIPVTYVENPVFDKTNNIYSLWLARKEFSEDDTILLESDLIFETAILDRLVRDPRPNLAVVAQFEHWMDGTVTLLDEEDEIVSFIPKKEFLFSEAASYFKTVNIYKFSRAFINDYYLPFLEAYSKAFGNNEYYEQVLKVLIFLKDTGLKAMRLEGEKWYEIDDAGDLDIASVMFKEGSDRLKSFQSRYGGYWRFSDMRDFCYLVNPYFPGEQYLEDFRYNFQSLVSHYPSGQDVLQVLAASYFGCHEKEVLVGNGAAELIKALLEVLPGTLGISRPTFNEYPERVGDGRLVSFSPKDRSTFGYTVDELTEWLSGVDTLVLVNPDNPSGHFLSESDVERVARAAEEQGKRLVLDESFADFAPAEERFSMMESRMLARYPGLVVIKSISKSYGVPGLRLGVMAAADRELVRSVRGRLSIWNINSFAEYFLQTISKYRSEYAHACDLIAAERARFRAELEEIPWLRVLPSRANYVMCELVDAPLTATQLAETLLRDGSFFIKDLTGKTGIPAGGQYIRLAVRDEEDDRALAAALKDMA